MAEPVREFEERLGVGKGEKSFGDMRWRVSGSGSGSEERKLGEGPTVEAGA